MTDVPSDTDQFERLDPVLTNKIVTHLKSQGIFDQFRRECMADVDTKPAYQNLRQRVEGSVAAFLRMNPWRPDMNKNQLRDSLRRHIQSGGFLDVGVDRIVDQVVNPKIYTVFLPKVEEVVQTCLGQDMDSQSFEPPPEPEVKPAPAKFQDKHNLAPRARISSFNMTRLPSIPNIEALKPPVPLDDEDKLSDSGFYSEMPVDRNYVADENDGEDHEDEDDEESPPFERHSQNDRLILGVRTDSSDSNSGDNQVVTTIVDDNLEEIIDNGDTALREAVEEEEDEESSSDEYVPKTPTINLEVSDGTVIEFSSISEYKQYQTTCNEESFEEVEEEVVSTQWMEETDLKEERSSNDVFGSGLKRKLDSDMYDDISSSSAGIGSTSDEGKYSTFSGYEQKKLKLEDDGHESESMSETMMNDGENDDSYTDKSLDMSDLKIKFSDLEHRGKSKDSKRSHHHHRHRESSGHQSSTSKDREVREDSVSSNHSSKEKTDSHKKHEVSKEWKDKERKKSDSSSSRHSEIDIDRRKADRSETDKRDRDDVENIKKEARHEHKEKTRHHYHDKERKKHDSHDKQLDGKKDHEASQKHDKDKRDSSKSSKHSHSSSKHSHRSSSERQKTEKDHRHRESSDKHKSHDGKSNKDKKHESKKRHREHCKSSEIENEGRRSTDRDSNGPSSSRSHYSSTSRSSASRAHSESIMYTGDKTTSNSDNTVSDNVESIHKQSEVIEQGIASPDPESIEDPWVESNFTQSECNQLKEDLADVIGESGKGIPASSHGVEDGEKTSPSDIHNQNQASNTKCKTYQTQSEHNKGNQPVAQSMEIKIERINDDVLQNVKENICIENDNNRGEDFPVPAGSVNDTSSEKENIEQSVNCTGSNSKISDIMSNADAKVVKFKKPKIAANIFEVRKIMQARRHLKRMEKKRMKLITKNNVEEISQSTETEETKINPEEININPEEIKNNIEEKNNPSNNEEMRNITEETWNNNKEIRNNNEETKEIAEKCSVKNISSPRDVVGEKPVGTMFAGFEDDLSDKIEKYNCFINRLKSEMATALSNFQGNSKLTTSVIDVSPELEEYVKTVLKGEVHRLIRVRVPPISDKHYRFDSKENAYILLEDEDDSLSSKKDPIDVTLNNVSPGPKNGEIHSDHVPNELEHPNKTFNGINVKLRHNSCDESISTANKTDKSPVVLEKNRDDVNGKSLKRTMIKKLPQRNRQKTEGPQSGLKPVEAEVADKISQKLICDVIGIQGGTVLPAELRGQTSPSSAEDGSEQTCQRDGRPVITRQPQRYDSSDLYKPRLQLSSRRVRAPAPPEVGTPVPVVVTRKRATLTPAVVPTQKRRR